MKKDITHFKKRLEEEKDKLEQNLAGMSKKNPTNENDWEAIPPRDVDEREPDLNEAADNIEDYESAFSTNDILEKRLNDIKLALKKIEDGSFGICKVGGAEHEIEDRDLRQTLQRIHVLNT